MQTALIVVAIVAIVLVALAIADFLRKLGKTTEDVSRFLKVTEEELTSTAGEVRTALGSVDRLVKDVAETAERIDRLTCDVERLVEGVQVASAAAKAVKSSTAGLVSVYEGFKQGMRTLRGSKETNKEGTFDE